MPKGKQKVVDAKGMRCPEPLLLLKQEMASLSAKQSLEIWVTDIHAELDFKIWCERFGHQILRVASIGDDEKICFKVTKSES